MDELIQTIYEQLMLDIAPTREGEESILLGKVKNAYREVKETRNYPPGTPDSFIDEDMPHFFVNIYNLAMYDFNMRGAEWQTTINENGEYRSFVDRIKVLADVTPFAVLVD